MGGPATSPAFVPDFVSPQLIDAVTEDWTGTFRSMASDVNVRIAAGSYDPAAAFADVEAVFAAVQTQCTRFDDTSDLMRANAAGDEWYRVGTYCFAAVAAAARAHLMTGGVFDPRVLRTLCALGYDRSQPFASGDLDLAATASADPTPARPERAVWAPGLDADRCSVRIGPDPIDLGGIGKGLAVRWAAQRLAETSAAFILEAGGDCYLAGDGPEGHGWNVAVEDPLGGSSPAAVLAVRDAACATSSIRLRKWTVDGKKAHHIVDPRTGAPGGEGLLSVTVVGADPADAEVWSKTLFLFGTNGIAKAAARHNVAALWIDEDGVLTASPQAEPYLIWRAT